MKKSLMMMALMMSFVNIIFSQIDTLDFTKSLKSDYCTSCKLQNSVNYILFDDGTVLKIGDNIKIGAPSGSNLTNQTSVGFGGSSSKMTNTFTYIMIGKMGMAAMYGVTYLQEAYKGKILEINNITYQVNKKRDMTNITLVLNNPGGINLTVLDLKSALEFGEIINTNRGMTSDEALYELKRVKDKLDLGLVSQEYYDSLKIELGRLIK